MAASVDTITLGKSITDGETIVSAGEKFALGFFSPPESSSRYLGIWYNKDDQRTVAWVANRNTSISDSSGILSINTKGALVLIMNSTNETVWSSNASRIPQNPVAVLLESGNLVVKDGNDNSLDNFLWQSFHYPCDTSLPGMKIGRNLVTGVDYFLSSWKSTSDPATGEFTFGIDLRGTPQLFLKRGQDIRYRAGSWNGIRWTGTPQLKENPVYTFGFVSNEKEVFYMVDVRNSSVQSRMTVNPSGVVQRFTLIERTRSWTEYTTVMLDQCDNYALCGAYASCDMNKSPEICECLGGYTPRSPGEWQILGWTEGCVRRAPFHCDHSNRFLRYGNPTDYCGNKRCSALYHIAQV